MLVMKDFSLVRKTIFCEAHLHLNSKRQFSKFHFRSSLVSWELSNKGTFNCRYRIVLWLKIIEGNLMGFLKQVGCYMVLATVIYMKPEKTDLTSLSHFAGVSNILVSKCVFPAEEKWQISHINLYFIRQPSY